jgi:hypothetical protein
VPTAEIPTVPGIVTAADMKATIEKIAEYQLPDGNIPWTPGDHTDPWNLIEATMALDLGGHGDLVERAFEWLVRQQRPDGGWYAYYQGDEVKDPTHDTNVTGYVANGVWHHHLLSGDTAWLEAMWPTVERAIDFVLDQQHPTGEIEWTSNPRGPEHAGALLTGSSSLYSSLRCAIAVAERLGHERPDWEVSLGSLAVAIAHRPERFLDKDRWAMDWYYPILGGVLRGYAAHARLASRWSSFVVEDRGVRCVADRPWVTAAETCELVMTLDSIGSTQQARDMFAWVQFLRADDGGYWTGMNFEDERFDAPGELFPVESPTWNNAAVVLAANVLGGTGPTAGFFRGENLPTGLTAAELIAAGTEIEAERAAQRASTRADD